MSCLEATFTLTPLSLYYSDQNNNRNYALLYCFGGDFKVSSPVDLSSLYASNRLYFDGAFACDPNLDYAQWASRKKRDFLCLVSGCPVTQQFRSSSR